MMHPVPRSSVVYFTGMALASFGANKLSGYPPPVALKSPGNSTHLKHTAVPAVPARAAEPWTTDDSSLFSPKLRRALCRKESRVRRFHFTVTEGKEACQEGGRRNGLLGGEPRARSKAETKQPHPPCAQHLFHRVVSTRCKQLQPCWDFHKATPN